MNQTAVIPAKAGIQLSIQVADPQSWTPAFAGVTARRMSGSE
jgi:hypothetical protein